MATTTELKIFAYSELEGKAKDKARDWLMERAFDGDWYDFVYDEWVGVLGRFGFYDININFSLSYSQGNGASFSAKIPIHAFLSSMGYTGEKSEAVEKTISEQPTEEHWKEVKKIVEGNIEKSERRAWVVRAWVVKNAAELLGTAKITNGHGGYYVHENTMRVEFDYCWLNEWTLAQESLMENFYDELQGDILHFSKTMSRAIYKALQSEEEWLSSDENLTSLAESNGYEFTKNGTWVGNL